MLQFFALIAWCTLLILPALLGRDLADDIAEAAEEWDRAAVQAEQGLTVDFEKLEVETGALLDRIRREKPGVSGSARRAAVALAEVAAEREPGAIERLVDALDRLAESLGSRSRGV